MVVYGLDSGDSGICKYAFDRSSVVNVIPLLNSHIDHKFGVSDNNLAYKLYSM